MVDVEFKKLEPNAQEPRFSKEGDAAADITSIQSTIIPAKEFRTVRTGLAIELPPGWEAQIRPRSGLAAKHGISITNSPGTIDSGYRGEIMVLLTNNSDKDFTVLAGDRVAQMAIREVPFVRFVESNKNIITFISSTVRGTDGLGSTGV